MSLLVVLMLFAISDTKSFFSVRLIKSPKKDFFKENDDYVIFTCECSSCLDSPVPEFLFQAAEATAGSNNLFRLINRTTADAKGVYTFIGNTLQIKRIRKPQEGKYCCAIKGERSNELSLTLKRGYPFSVLLQKSYTLQEGSFFELPILQKKEAVEALYVFQLAKETHNLDTWDLKKFPVGKILTYSFKKPVSLNDSGLYSLKMVHYPEKEPSWNFTVHVERVPAWLHPTCVVLNSSSVRVQWNHSSDHSDDRFWVIVRDPFGRETNVSASARQSSVTIHRLTSHGCGQYTVETVGTQGTRSNSPVSCEKDPQGSESGRFAKDANGTVVYVGDKDSIMSVCLPPSYVDDVENEGILCQKFGNLTVIESPRDELFVEIPTVEVNLGKFSTSGACVLSCPQNRTMNVAKCKPLPTSPPPSATDTPLPSSPSRPSTSGSPTQKRIPTVSPSSSSFIAGIIVGVLVVGAFCVIAYCFHVRRSRTTPPTRSEAPTAITLNLHNGATSNNQFQEQLPNIERRLNDNNGATLNSQIASELQAQLEDIERRLSGEMSRNFEAIIRELKDQRDQRKFLELLLRLESIHGNAEVEATKRILVRILEEMLQQLGGGG